MATEKWPPSAETGRRMAWPYVQQWVSEGVSANEIQRRLRDVGLGYRRAEILRDVRIIKSGIDIWQTMPRPREGQPVDLSVGTVREVNIPTNYQVNMVVERRTSVVTETGAVVTRISTMVRAVQTNKEVVLPEELEGDLLERMYAAMYSDEAARTKLRIVRWYAPWKRRTA